MADNKGLCSCLDNKAQIISVLNTKEQIASDLGTVKIVSIQYSAGESDNIDLIVDNQTREISASIKEIQFDSAEKFPPQGSDRLIYVDKSTRNAYIWDSETQTYNSISNGGEIAVDSELSNTSENPVQNKVITDTINKIVTNKTQISGDADGKFLAGKVLSSGIGSIGIGGNLNVGQRSVVIGSESTTAGNSDILIGVNNQRLDNDLGGGGHSSIAIGGRTRISGVGNMALGRNAQVDVRTNYGSDTVQIAEGINTTAGSLQFRSYQLVDPNGKIPNERLSTDLSDTASLTEENTFSGKQTFNGEIEVNGESHHSKNVSLTDSVIKVLDTTNDAVTIYGSKEITVEQNGTVVTHKLSLPDKSGTLLTDADFNTKHSKIQNADTETEHVDEWRLTDNDAKIKIVSLVENNETKVDLERNYAALKHAGALGAGEVSVSANKAVMESKDLSGNITNLTVSPEKATINEKEIITIAGGTFENRPKVKENGTAVDVSTKSDLENYLEKQSDKEGIYSQVTNQDGQFSVNISENGETQTFIINKNGVTLNGSNLFTSVGGTITGDVNIQGNVTVTGDTTIEKTKNLEVENAIIYTNANKTELKTILSGLAIYKDGTNIYGIMYDPATDSVKLGLGTVDAEGKFIFNSGEGKPVAVRSDSSLFVDGHLIKWDSASNSFVDSGKEVSENATAHSIAERTIGGALKSTPISDIDIENQTNNTVATKKDISNKVDKVAGKQLSSNDYTDDDKTKLSGLSNYDDTNIKKEISEITDAIRNMDTAFSQELANKQNILTAGNNITISDNTISAIDTKYTAGTGIEINADNVISAVGESGPNVVQATGQSETDVMSQKATTDALGNKITKNMLDIYVGTNDTCSDAEGNFGQCSQIYKSDGTSYAVRQFLFNKDDFQQDGTNEKTKYSLAIDVLRTASISQETGSATDKIMSQDSVTKELAKSVKKTDIVDNLTSTDTTVPLSANQGKVLDDKISSTNQQLSLAKAAITGLQNSVADNTTDIANAQSTAGTALTTANGAVSKNTEQDASISALQTADSQNVKLTGDQSVGGVKDFTGTFKINGGIISYDSATDTFTI